MEISTNLLVALMFVTILTLGIASLLSALANIISHYSKTNLSWLHTNWTILLLIIHLNAFWHTLAITSIEGWGFSGFLYIIAGPIFLFFAASVLLTDKQPTDHDPYQHYLSISRSFFYLMALAQLWVIGADFVLARGFTGSGIFNLILMILVLILAFTRRPGVHKAGVSLAWFIILSSAVLRGFGVIV